MDVAEGSTFITTIIIIITICLSSHVEQHISTQNNSTGKADNNVNNDLVVERNQLAFRISGLEASELALESERIATLEKMRRQEEEMDELKKRAEVKEWINWWIGEWINE